MPLRTFLLAFTLLIAAPFAHAQAQTPGRAATFSESQKLHALLEAEWEWALKEFPTFATYVGDARFNDRLPDLSLAAIARRNQHARALLQKVTAISRAKLQPNDTLNYDLYLRGAREAVEEQRFPDEYLAINQMGGVHSELAELAQVAPRRNVRDFEAFVRRMRAFPVLVDQNIVLLRKGLETGITPPQVTLREVAKLLENQIVDDPTRSPVYQIAFNEFPASVSAGEQARLKQAGAEAVREAVVPALRRLRDFWVSEYFPKTRTSIGLAALPDGKAWYAFNVKQQTTTGLSPDQIHAIGIAEVARIRAEMEAIKGRTGFKGSLAEFFTFLRSDGQFFFGDKEQLLMAYRDISKRIDPELPKLFGTLPRLPYGVVPVPSYSEKTQTTAYYLPGSLEAGRAGTFYANTYDLRSRPKWEMEALTAHEAVPGHHLQISIAQELAGLPKFRRFGHYTAFVEGWGLYSESLGSELGLYKDPYSKFGQLTYEMWRAIRLVVDTGLHSKGWSRERAIAYFTENAGKADHDIAVEVDRYIVWPGQALAYKIGELKIKELRAHANRKLGVRFDIRRFHDLVLGAGALPLSVLETRVKAWVVAQKASRKPA